MKPITVTQLNEYISKILRSDINLSKIVVIGEISGYRYRTGKHIFFDLIDGNSKISCNIWESYRGYIDEKIIDNGKKVIVIGSVNPYSKNGTYSINIVHMEEKGKGEENEAFLKLKNKLEKEGLFDQKYKKNIPEFPGCIGVVTASNGAAVEDIKKSIRDKNTYTDIIIFDTIVQGTNAPRSIINSIVLANKLNEEGSIRIDTLIVGRGGGSAEDLSCFNDEDLARAIFSSKIPIISAVGHETDFSISDFVADVRANTPNAAGEMAVMNTYELIDEINQRRDSLIKNIINKIQYEEAILLSQIDILRSNVKNKLLTERAILEKAELYLIENNPMNILSKGYSLVRDGDGNTLYHIDDIEIGKEYSITIQDGEFNARVLSKRRK